MIDATLGNGQNAGLLDWNRVALNPYNQQFNLLIERQIVSSDEAIRLFEAMGEGYKVELIRDLGADQVAGHVEIMDHHVQE